LHRDPRVADNEPVSTPAAGRPLWLFGPRSDLLIGCGLLYAITFALCLTYGKQLRSAQPDLTPHLIGLLIGTPHYGATLLRVYEKRSERRAYALFTVWATLAVVGAFTAALWVPALGSFLVTLYLTWSPWHYTGQNYGLAVMFLRRGGVDLAPNLKRWLYLSFLFSFLLVLMGLHRSVPGVDPAAYFANGTRFQPIGIPAPLANAAGAAFFAASLFSLARAAIGLRAAPRRVLVAAGSLALSQILWFSLPFAVNVLGVVTRLDPLQFEFRPQYFLWIGAAHSAQYLWVTAYYARESGPWHGQLGNYARVLLVGSAAFALPAMLFGTRGIGPLAFDRGLGEIVEAAVNLHHFILDGAIWKLRGRIAEVLIRRRPAEAEARELRRGPALRRAVWSLCALAFAASVFGIAGNAQLTLDTLAGRFERAQKLAEGLAWIGRDRAGVRSTLAQHLANARHFGEARAQWLHVEALLGGPTAVTRERLAQTHEAEGDYRAAAERYESALALAGPAAEARAALLRRAGAAWLAAGAPQRALGLLEESAALNSESEGELQSLLARARQAASSARSSAAPLPLAN
jgi:tetratricopeptide (TPR) repeat protein